MAKKTAPKKTERPDDNAMRARGFTPFLRPEHTGNGEYFRLTGFNQDDGTQFKIEVANEKGDCYTLGVRKGSPSHRIMYHALGEDPLKWRGGVSIVLTPGTRGDGVVFVNVATADQEEPF